MKLRDLHILVEGKKHKNMFLEIELKRYGIGLIVHDIPNYTMQDRINKYRIIILYIKYIQQAIKAVRETSSSDLLICTNFTTSIAVGFACKMMIKTRTILALNIIAHKRPPILEKLRKTIFHQVMKMDTFYLTVNSQAYIEEYAHRFGINPVKFHILQDCYPSSIVSKPFTPLHSYVFVGGEAERDWETLFTACRMLPEISFECVARRKSFDTKLSIPPNVKLQFDAEYEMFRKKMGRASIVVLPLKSHLPCGLIVLLDAALMRKPIIATNTPATRNYIEDGISGFLTGRGNPDELARKISVLYSDIDMQRKFATEMIDRVTINHSPQRYARSLFNIINEIYFSRYQINRR